jgi:hypothetical protein
MALQLVPDWSTVALSLAAAVVDLPSLTWHYSNKLALQLAIDAFAKLIVLLGRRRTARVT